MTESNEKSTTEDKKPKMSYKDMVKQQLEAKKNKQTTDNSTGGTLETKKMKSQQSKKVNNSHRKMGI